MGELLQSEDTNKLFNSQQLVFIFTILHHFTQEVNFKFNN